MQYLVVLIRNRPLDQRREWIFSPSLPLVAPLAASAFIDARNSFSRTLGTLLSADAMLATRHPREWLAGSTFLIARRPLVNSAVLTPFCPPHCFALFRMLGDLHGYPPSFWLPALSWMLSTPLLNALPPIRCTYSSLLGILVVTRPFLATLRQTGYSIPFSVLLVTQRFSVRSSPLAFRYPQWPCWSLLALPGALPWHILHCLAPSWLLGVFRSTG